LQKREKQQHIAVFRLIISGIQRKAAMLLVATKHNIIDSVEYQYCIFLDIINALK